VVFGYLNSFLCRLDYSDENRFPDKEVGTVIKDRLQRCIQCRFIMEIHMAG
jgi:hypothetical protein